MKGERDGERRGYEVVMVTKGSKKLKELSLKITVESPSKLLFKSLSESHVETNHSCNYCSDH